MEASRVRRFIDDHPLAAWSLAWGGLLALLAVLVRLAVLVAPDATLAFLWREIVGPWVAEATHQRTATWDGHVATTGYTLALEALYVGLILFAMVTAWALLARPLDQPLARRLIYAITPAALAGTLARVLEDGLVFCQAGTPTTGCQAGAFSYVAISPLNILAIYLAVCLIAGLLARGRHEGRSEQRRQARWLLAGQAGLTIALGALAGDEVSLWLPWTALLFFLGDPVYAALRDRGWRHVEAGVLASGLAWLGIATVHLAAWLADPLTPTRTTLAYPVWVLATTGLATGAVWATARLAAPRFERARALASGLGAWIIGSHLLDAFATIFAVCSPASQLCDAASFTGLALPAYGEKHPVSEAFLGVWDGWAYPVVKLVLPAAFLLAAAGYLGDEDEEARIGLYVLILWYAGLVPGVRDVLRTVMGI